MFKIGDFSKLTFVSIRNLRYYDEIGLFKPVKVDNFTNYRYYSASQIPELNTIVTLKQLGFNSDEVRQVIAAKDTTEGKVLLEHKRVELAEKLEQDQIRLNELSHYITHYNEESNNMKYDVVIKDVPGLYVVALKKVIPAYDQEHLLWQEMMQKSQRMEIQFGPRCMSRFHEEPTDAGAEVEICNEVIQLQEDQDGLKFFELEPIKGAATLLIAGPYVPGIQEGFNYMAKWLEDNHYQFAGPTRTDYIIGPGLEDNPDNYLTEIIVPIQPVD